MTEPEYVRLQLPVDTITHKVDKAVLAMMATEDGDIAHHLILNTEFGCYKFQLADNTAGSLMAQFVAHNEFGKQLQREPETEQ